MKLSPIRYETLFSVRPPWAVAVHTERVPMVKGRYDPTAASATSYAWLFWRTDTADRLPIDWIPPCRRRLERPGDYALPNKAATTPHQAAQAATTTEGPLNV